MSEYLFPHQHLMKKNRLDESSLDGDSLGYLQDFESYLGHLQSKKESAELEGTDFELTDTQKKKLLRLSKSISNSIIIMLEEKREQEEELERKERQKEEERRKEEESKNKPQKDDSFGWF
jgi:hypothetical protein